METLPADLLADSQLIDSNRPWVWLYTLEVDRTSIQTLTIAFTSYDKPQTVNGVTYTPYPVAHSDIEISDDQALPRIDLTLTNVTRELGPYFEEGEGFIGRPASLAFMLADNTDPDQVYTIAGLQVAGAEISNEALLFTLEGLNFFEQEFPQEFYARDRCPWAFKGSVCRYRGPELFCSKRISACVTFGNAEVAAGAPRMHPRQFGAFPGLTKTVA